MILSIDDGSTVRLRLYDVIQVVPSSVPELRREALSSAIGVGLIPLALFVVA